MIFIADRIACSTCFGHHYAHHQELESIIQVVAACVIWCFGFQVVGIVWSWGLCVRFAGCCSSLQTVRIIIIIIIIIMQCTLIIHKIVINVSHVTCGLRGINALTYSTSKMREIITFFQHGLVFVQRRRSVPLLWTVRCVTNNSLTHLFVEGMVMSKCVAWL